MIAGYQTIKIMLLDDHDIVLHGLRASIDLKKDMEVIGLFRESQALLLALRKQIPDVLIMDYSLRPGELDGLNLIRLVATRYPQCKVLVLSANTNTSIVKMAMQAGAAAYFGKEKSADELIFMIRNVTQGSVKNDKRVAIGEEERMDIFAVLSPKECEVIRCCLEGMSVTDIAEKFSRSIKTISTQKHNAYNKLGVDNDNALHKLWYQANK